MGMYIASYFLKLTYMYTSCSSRSFYCSAGPWQGSLLHSGAMCIWPASFPHSVCHCHSILWPVGRVHRWAGVQGETIHTCISTCTCRAMLLLLHDIAIYIMYMYMCTCMYKSHWRYMYLASAHVYAPDSNPLSVQTCSYMYMYSYHIQSSRASL